MAKDIGLYLANAVDAGVPRELAETTVALWRRFHQDHPDSDFTFIHRYLSEREQ
jgi:3-hydroxyisobutyrate dehydrogenase-like beta-hydroxyacid dehydrogenase